MSRRTNAQSKALIGGAGWTADFIQRLIAAVEAKGGQAEDLIHLTQDRWSSELGAIADRVLGWTIVRTVRIEVANGMVAVNALRGGNPKWISPRAMEVIRKQAVARGLVERLRDRSYIVDVGLLQLGPWVDHHRLGRLMEVHNVRFPTIDEFYELCIDLRRIKYEDCIVSNDSLDALIYTTAGTIEIEDAPFASCALFAVVIEGSEMPIAF